MADNEMAAAHSKTRMTANADRHLGSDTITDPKLA
jgi:hypothetical protein